MFKNKLLCSTPILKAYLSVLARLGRVPIILSDSSNVSSKCVQLHRHCLKSYLMLYHINNRINYIIFLDISLPSHGSNIALTRTLITSSSSSLFDLLAASISCTQWTSPFRPLPKLWTYYLKTKILSYLKCTNYFITA